MKYSLSNVVGYNDSSAQKEIYSTEYIFSKEDLKLIIKVSTLIVQTTTQSHSSHTLAK